MVLQRNRTPLFAAPVFVFEQVARDGEDPAAKSGVPPPACDPAKGSKERLLHQVIYIGVIGTETHQKSGDRRPMSAYQLSRRGLASALVSADEVGVIRRRRTGRNGHLRGDAEVRETLSLTTREGRPSFRAERTFGRLMLAYDKRLQHLLTVAARTYAERGYQATSMRDLSKASGFSLAGIYHYVSSKLELLYLIQDRCFSQVIAGAREALDKAGDEPEARLAAFIQHHVTFFAAHMDEVLKAALAEDPVGRQAPGTPEPEGEKKPGGAKKPEEVRA